MAHLIETYAKTVGVKIGKPYIQETYFPLPTEKFITFSPISQFDSKNYNLWQETLNLLQPILIKNDIHIVQLGVANEEQFTGTIRLNGLTNYNQTAYLISKSLLHLSVDTLTSHIGSYYKKPMVVLFGNNYPSCTGPYFSGEEVIVLEPDRRGRKPCLSVQEQPKTINWLNPEDIVKSVCKLLNLEFNYSYKSLYFGQNYNTRMIESVPNQVIDINGLGISNLIIRMDLHFDEQNLERQLQNCRCGIVTNKPVSLDLINKYKQQIVEIVYVLDESHSLDFVKFAYYSGTSLVMLSRLSEEKVNELKLIYMEYGIIWRKIGGKIDEIEGKDEIYYKSNSFLLSDGKIYQSEYDYLNNRPIPKLESTLQLVIKNDNFDLFGRDKDRFYFLEKNKT